MTVSRLLPRPDEPEQLPEKYVLMAEWLELLEHQRDVLIMELRYVERVLIRHGRLREESLSRRMR